MEIKTLVDTLNKNIIEDIKIQPKDDNLFTRSYLFFTLVYLLKSRADIRLKLAEFIVYIFNKKILPKDTSVLPYNILLIPYGESGIGAVLEDAHFIC